MKTWYQAVILRSSVYKYNLHMQESVSHLNLDKPFCDFNSIGRLFQVSAPL